MNRFKMLQISLFLAAITLLAGCGGTVFQGANGSAAGAGDSLPSTTSVSTSNQQVTTGIAPYIYHVGTIGYNSVTVQVNTRTILNVEFTPGVQNQDIPGTGATANYSKLGVYISVGNNTQATPMLSNAYNGATAQTSPVLNFASGFTPTCAASDTSCEQQVTVTVGQPNNDYYCLNFGEYCPWTHVVSNQPWNGTLTIQTDDTNSL